MKSIKLPNTNTLNYILFFTLAILWSGSYINIKIVVNEYPPIFSAFMRVLVSLATLVLAFTMMRKNIFRFDRQTVSLWLVGFFSQALPFMLLFYGEKFIAPALASILNSTVTIWSLLLGMLLFKDFMHWTPLKSAGIFLGFIGIVIIFLPFIHGSDNSLIGILSVLGMSISYALGSLISQHIVFKKMQVSLELTLVQQHLASVIFLAIMSLSFETWPTIESLFDPKAVMAFLYLGVMATALAWMMYFHLLKQWGAIRAVSVMYLVPLLAILWDALFLHIRPTLNEMIGVVMILMSVTLIQWTRKTKVQPALQSPLREEMS